MVGDHSAQTFAPLWNLVTLWNCYFYVTDGNRVYPMFVTDADHIVSKTYMTRVEGENTRLVKDLPVLSMPILSKLRIRRTSWQST